jgi:hypothetical protein
MRLRNAFGRDVRRAINATGLRKAISFGSTAVLVASAILFASVTPWWLWLVLLGLEAAVFLILGNVWAAQDAAAANREARDEK